MKAFLMSFVYAWRGVRLGLAGRNFRVMLAVAVMVTAAGFRVGLTGAEWGVICGCIGLVLGLELLNTAGERLVDTVSTDFDPRLGAVKDLLAGAVLIAALASVAAGLVIFLPKVT